MPNRSVLIPTACLAATLAATTELRAQQLEEVVVTAQKREQGVNDVGITVNTFTADQLASHGVRSAGDLELLTPGLTVTESASTGVPVYTIRGVGFSDLSTASSSTVGLYLDEAEIPYSVMSRGVLFDVERVEVLKGPQGDLYGRNTTAGQINFISRKPTKDFNAGVNVDFSRFNVLDVDGYVSDSLSDNVQARLAAKVVHSNEGWQESISRPGDTLGAKDEIALRAITNVDFSDSVKLLLSAHWDRDRSENVAPTAYDGLLVGFDSSQPLPTAEDATPYFSVGNNRLADWSENFRPHRDNTLKGGSARLSWDFTDKMNLTSVTAYDKFNRAERYELSGVPFEDGNTDNGTDLKVFSQELRLSSSATPDLYWIAGAHYSHDDLSELYDMYFRDSYFGFGLGINGIDTRYTQTTESIAGFGHVEWSFAPKLKLTLGARFASETRKWTGCTNDTGDGSLAGAWNNILTPFTILANGLPDPGPALAGGCGIYDDIAGTADFGTFAPFTDKISTNKWMWKSTLDYSPTDDMLLYGTISTGFKSGGFNGASAQTHSQLLPYRAETLTSFEMGVKSTLMDGRMQLNAATFYYDYKDKQEPTVAVTPVGNIAGLTNVPKSEVHGAEVELRWRVVQGLTLDLGVSYVDSKIKEYEAIDAANSSWPNIVRFDASGFELANSPNWQANATGTYQWPISGKLDMFLATDVAYKGDTSGSTQDPLSDYVLVNGRVGLKDSEGHWTATLWGRNVFNEYYWTAAYGSNGTFVRLNGMPATYGVSMSYTF
ncbi:MAG: TonB-dependent receptor [Gammaproteobacteria bacterium]